MLNNDDIVLYTVKDICKIFKCGSTRGYEIVNTNGFPSIKVGGKILVEKGALATWLEKNCGKTIITK